MFRFEPISFRPFLFIIVLFGVCGRHMAVITLVRNGNMVQCNFHRSRPAQLKTMMVFGTVKGSISCNIKAVCMVLMVAWHLSHSGMANQTVGWWVLLRIRISPFLPQDWLGATRQIAGVLQWFRTWCSTYRNNLISLINWKKRKDIAVLWNVFMVRNTLGMDSLHVLRCTIGLGKTCICMPGKRTDVKLVMR